MAALLFLRFYEGLLNGFNSFLVREGFINEKPPPGKEGEHVI